MKRIILFSCLLVFLFTLSHCKDKEEVPSNTYPVWLKQMVQETGLNQDLCEVNQIMTIEYNNKKYYNIQPAISSCMYCELYSDSGTKVSLDETTWLDFVKNMKIIKSESACNLHP